MSSSLRNAPMYPTRKRSNVGRAEFSKRVQHRNYDKEVCTQETCFYCGYLLFFSLLIVFLLSMYAIIGTRVLPATGIHYFDLLREDSYYCLLLPLLIPVIIIFVYFNWLGLKIFRHS